LWLKGSVTFRMQSIFVVLAH